MYVYLYAYMCNEYIHYIHGYMYVPMYMFILYKHPYSHTYTVYISAC